VRIIFASGGISVSKKTSKKRIERCYYAKKDCLKRKDRAEEGISRKLKNED